MTKQPLEIAEGIIEIIIRPGNVYYNDHEYYKLMHLTPANGTILIEKDDDNKFKFTHYYMGKGTTVVEHDVSDLDQEIKHYFAVTWNVKNTVYSLKIDDLQVNLKEKTIGLNVDGQPVAESPIAYEYYEN